MSEEIAFRIVFSVVFLATFMISGYHRWKARQAAEVIPRRAEGGTAMFLRALMGLVVLACYLAYAFGAPGFSWAGMDLPRWLRWGAASLALSVLPGLWWVFLSIGPNISETILTKSTHRLVTHGPYRWVRHPLYALALVQMALLALIADSWLLLLFPVVGAAVFRLIIIPKEERNLLAAFGREYQDYQARTGALLPRLRR